MDELNKIEFYFSEGLRLWSVNPELVISRHFYELWEKVHHPRPFAIENMTITLLGVALALIDDNNLIGYYTWEASEECCCLCLEGEKTTQKYLMIFEDGFPRILEPKIEFHDIREISFGERLEVIYDIISEVQTNHLHWDSKAITRKDYLKYLALIESNYDRGLISVMKQLNLDSIRKLFQKAIEDMALDELSNQLTLPLDGNYAAAIKTKLSDEMSAEDHPTTEYKCYPVAISQRTAWNVLCELRLLQQALQSQVDFEKNYFIKLTSAHVIEQFPDGSLALKLPFDRDLTINEGEVLQVFKRGDSRPVGVIFVDLYDRESIMGRLQWNESRTLVELNGDFFARPRKSAFQLLSLLFTALTESYNQTQKFASKLLNGILGIDELNLEYCLPPLPAVNNDLDSTQYQAKSNALNPNNPLVIIQGPPGTGKTHVLVGVIRELVAQNRRILVTAPSNTAVDNICRRIMDLPVLRIGKDENSIAPDIAARIWVENPAAVKEFLHKRKRNGSVYCGTHIGILKDDLVNADWQKNGLYDAIVFDETGMTQVYELLLCVQMTTRAILFGDHQQLPPFPLPASVIAALNERGPMLRREWLILRRSVMEWLIEVRGLTPFLLQSSYRCQNPRLLRFASILFYNARVKTSEIAEYYHLPYNERQSKYPDTTLRLYRTSSLPLDKRRETLVMESAKPGLENRLEAELVRKIFYEFLQRYSLQEITIIAPYRRQVRLLRSLISREKVVKTIGDINDEQWKNFLHTRIATVDSFQGGESDAVIITYVRSNENDGIGFVDDPNRINVAHTRCRREMVVIADIDCLQRQSANSIFNRMERACRRDGVVIDVTETDLMDWENDGINQYSRKSFNSDNDHNHNLIQSSAIT